MKFKVGDLVVDLIIPGLGTGIVRTIDPTDIILQYRVDFRDSGYCLWVSEENLRLKEEQKMQNKNELKVGCHILRKQSDGSLWVFTSDGSPVYLVRSEACDKLKDFLSTPAEEEEIRVAFGDRVKRKYYGDVYIVSSTGDGKMTLVNLVDGLAWTKPVERTDCAVPLKELIGSSRLSEWEVIK